MSERGERIQVNITTTADVRDKLAELCEATGKSQAAVLEQIIMRARLKEVVRKHTAITF